MTTTSTFGIVFHTIIAKKRKDGKVPIYLRITIDGVRTEFSIKRFIDPGRWNSLAGKAKGTNDDSKDINHHINVIRNKIKKAHTQLIDEEKTILGPAIIKRFTGKDENVHTLVTTFNYFIKKINERVGIDYAPATITRYKTTLTHIKNFLSEYYTQDDIQLKKLDFAFVSNLEQYFKVTKTCSHNTTMKYIKNLKRIVHFAMEQDWLDADPFFKFKTTIKEVKRDYLTDEELDSLVTKEITIKRLDLVRDIFVFSCFTGLAYIDIVGLNQSNIKKGIDGNDWLVVDRKKTGTQSRIILLPKAIEIINKYKDHPLVQDKESLLPIYSNQRMNGYLKEIGTLCKIEKNLHFHLSRHTFATTITLKNGVPIETVSKMLGHTSIKTTQIYAKVVDKKISNDMSKLKDKLSNTKKPLEKINTASSDTN